MEVKTGGFRSGWLSMPADEPLPLGMDSIDYYFKPSVMRRDGVVSFLLHSLGMFQTRLW